MAWKAVLEQVRDIGNGSGDVTWGLYNGETRIKGVTKNYHAGQCDIESGKQEVINELMGLIAFEAIAAKVQSLVGVEVVIPDEVEASIVEAVNNG